ncbi:IS3 family transposase, partial [Phascolarctobacterium sp.]
KFDENCSFEELQSVVDSYIHFYRYERYQENLKQKTPFEYSRYLQLAV